MSDSALLNKLPQIYFERKTVRNATYVKAFDGNEWIKEKGYAIKKNPRTIGVISSGSGCGLIRFTTEFITMNPDFKDVAVVRYQNDSTGKFELKIEHSARAHVITRQIPKCSHDVKSVLSVGVFLVARNLLADDPLLTCLKQCFPSTYEKLLSLALYCLDTGDFKSNRYALYARSHKLLDNTELSPSAITRLFQSISETDELNFFKFYTEELYQKHKVASRRFWALDSTSISTYAGYTDAKYGHNKQNEDIPQINVMMLTDQKSGRPLFYSRFNGSIPDVSTVASTFNTLLHIGTRSFVAVMDRGYYSKDNLDEMVSTGYHFLICVPLEKVSTFKEEIHEASVAFLKGDKYISAIDENVFTKEGEYEFRIKGKRVKKKLFVHVFYDQERAGAITKKIQKRRSEVIKMLNEHAELDGDNKSFTERYLIQNEDGNIELNNGEFQKANEKAGIFVLVSDVISDGKQAYYGYKDRRTVEDCFLNLKVKMCCDRFNTSSEDSLPGKCFVEFLALTLYMRMIYILRSNMDNGKPVPHHSVRTILRELDGIKEITFADSYVTVLPVSKSQKESLHVFGVKEPVNRYEEKIAIPNMVKYARKPHGDKA
ncbi:MAG: transposase [Succinivibrio sp.]